MSSTPVQPTLTQQSAETVEECFRRLAAAWHQAVAHHSSTTVRNSHPAYREIMGMCPDVVPLFLRDLEDNHTHWFCALREITGADPIRSRSRLRGTSPR